ncbi:(Fe-S)-binding protein [Desulfocicer niacini]
MNYPFTVSLFATCLVDTTYPGAGHAVTAILNKCGINIDCPPDQTCCGQPAFNAGYQKEARRVARHFIEVFENSKAIVSPSGSCVHMVRHHYPILFKDDSSWHARAIQVAAKTFEFTEFLVNRLNITDVGARFNGTITYHDACHMHRGLGITEAPRQLIQNIKGLTFKEMTPSDKCCGFGGLFSVKYPEISQSLARDKAMRIVETGADAVVSSDVGCLMNIEGILHEMNPSIRCLHIAQLLAGDCHD